MGTKDIVLSIIISVLILVAQTGFWYNRNIINPENFKSTLNEGLLSDGSRRAIATEVVDRSLARRPILKEFLGDAGQSVVYSLLGTRFFESTLDRLTTRVHARINSPAKPDFSIDLTRFKQIAIPIIERLDPETGDKINADNIPDQINIIDQSAVPSLYQINTRILWISWISFMAGLLISTYYFYSTKNRNRSLKTLGIALSVFCAILLVALLTLEPIFTSNIANLNLHTVAENISQAFLSSFIRQTVLLMFFGVVLFFAGVALPKVTNTIDQNKK